MILPGGILLAMDALSTKILRALARDGSLTQAAIAEEVGLSLSACQRRIKALEATGAIRGYRTLIDPALLDEGLTVFVAVDLARHARAQIQAFQADVAALPMVKEVHRVAGAHDYLLRVAVKDIAAYEAFYADRLTAVGGIARITSFVAMSTLEDRP